MWTWLDRSHPVQLAWTNWTREPNDTKYAVVTKEGWLSADGKTEHQGICQINKGDYILRMCFGNCIGNCIILSLDLVFLFRQDRFHCRTNTHTHAHKTYTHTKLISDLGAIP